MFEIKNLTIIYPNGKLAVNNLSMHVQAGDVYGFIGKNGAGKTSTLKACFGMIPITDGDILLYGNSIKRQAVLCKKMMAFVPDEPMVEDYMTGIQYFNFVSDIYNISTKTRKENIEYYSNVFSMEDKLNLPILSYSHGMKQKIALIAAFIHEPKLLILDEPFVGLDPEAFVVLKREMKNLCKKGSAVLFSSHILDVVEKSCNKIAILKNGKCITSGNIREVIGDQNLEEVFMEMNEK